MKRAQADDEENDRRPKRRAKTSEACLGCRKSKTRCEPPSDHPSRACCHRCTVLFLPCSFEEASSPSTSTATSPGSGVNSHQLGGFDGLDKDASAPPINQPPPFDVTGLTPEDLVSLPSAAGKHWISAPMSAMQELLQRRPNTHQPHADFSLPPSDILDQGHIDYLLSIFETHYTPWMNLAYTDPLGASPRSLTDFLTLARCTVASRHFPLDFSIIVLPRLQKLVEHALLIHMFNASKSPSLGAAQALLILSLWSPAVGPLASVMQDAGLIAKSAIKMGLAMGLDHAMDELVASRQRARTSDGLSEDEEREDGLLLYKSRLWYAICNTDRMLSLGTSSKPSLNRSIDTSEILNSRLFTGTATIEDIRTFRLRLGAHFLEIVQRGLDVKIKDLKTFAAQMDNIFLAFSRARNCMQPLQVTFPHERMYMDAVLLQADHNILITFFHAVTQIQSYVEVTAPDQTWLGALEDSSDSILLRWGTSAMNSAQHIMITFFDIIDRCNASMSSAFPTSASAFPTNAPLGANSRPTAPCLSSPFSTAPDSFFAAVLFAASAMIVVRYTVVHHFKRLHSTTWFTTGAILGKLADTLDALAVSDEHAPRRAAIVVRELERVWHEKVTSQIVVENPGLGWLSSRPPPAAPYVPTAGTDALQDGPPARSTGDAEHSLYGLPTGAVAESTVPPSFGNWPLNSLFALPQALAQETGNGLGAFPPSFVPYSHTTAATTFASAETFGATAPPGFSDDDFWASFMGSFGATPQL